MRNFEDILRDKLKDASADYSDNIWQNIRTEIPTTEKGKYRYLWLGTLLASFLFIAYSIQQYPEWQKNQPKAQESSKWQASIDDLNRMYLSDPIQPMTLKNITALDYTDINIESQRAEDEKYLRQSKTLNQNNSSQISTQKAIVSESTNSNISLTSFFDEPNQNSGFIAIEENLINNNVLISDISNKHSSKIGLLSPIGALAPTALMLASLKDPIGVSSLRKRNKTEVHCEVLQGPNNRTYFTARHISNYAFSNLSENNLENGEYMDSRYASESKKYSFADEIAVGLEYRSGFFAELGIRYDQINEKFSYKDSGALQNATVITSDTLMTGTEVFIISDTITTDLPGLREVVNHNRFRKISIPLSIGYQIPLNKKVSVAAKAGAMLNLWSSYQGKMFDENIRIIDIAERQQTAVPIFKKLVHSISGSAYLQYKMNKQMEIMVGLNAYKHLGSTTNPNYPIQQRYSSLGIFIGGKYHI